jgi:hypothetical protein
MVILYTGTFFKLIESPVSKFHHYRQITAIPISREERGRPVTKRSLVEKPFVYLLCILHLAAGGRDSAPVRGVPYEPAAPYKVCRAKFESVEIFWRVVATVEEL